MTYTDINIDRQRSSNLGTSRYMTYLNQTLSETHLCFLSFASASATCLVTIAIRPIPSISTSEFAGDDELVFS